MRTKSTGKALYDSTVMARDGHGEEVASKKAYAAGTQSDSVRVQPKRRGKAWQDRLRLDPYII